MTFEDARATFPVLERLVHLNAGTFGPNDLDATFGPQLVYIKAPTKEQGQNLHPSMGLQFFGHVAVNGTDSDRSPVSEVAAFQEFTREIADRCDEQPQVSEMHEVGAYRGRARSKAS